ncbi:chaperone protein dnaJ 10-like [Salvia divinorum]|uniref:Chaperone protein dnaJ 10-like n=1 Tax=Salvia divinorum TaxID=28513 RepID=A0ABD1HYR7_SALDI
MVDIEITLVHVFQWLVLQDSHVRREELGTRTVALKHLGRVFQSQKLNQNGGTSKKKVEDDSSSDSSDDDDSHRPLNYKTPLVTQVSLFRCLCKPAFDVDDDEIVYRGR